MARVGVAAIGGLVHAGHTAMKRFPPRAAGVLLPAHDRAAAAAGVCMYTACRPMVLRAQRLAYIVVKRFGTRALGPWGHSEFDLPMTQDQSADMVTRWEATVGHIDAIAVYQRRQALRGGLTMVAVRDARAVGVIKLREGADREALDREQRALLALESAGPVTFRAPRALGQGSVGDWHWSMQESLFSRPHAPVLEARPELFDEVSCVLATIVEDDEPGLVPSHRDITPWNLRWNSDHEVCLYDWEDWGLSPRDADRAYFAASSRAVGGPAMPVGLPGPAIAYHRAIVTQRHLDRAPGVSLPARILRGFDEAERSADGS